MERLTAFNNGIWGMSVKAVADGYDRYSVFSKLAGYENLEDLLQGSLPGEEVNIESLIKLYIKHLEDKEGEQLKGYQILTNNDAKLYDEWKKDRHYWKHQSITDKSNLGLLRIWLTENGMDMDDVLDKIREQVK